MNRIELEHYIGEYFGAEAEYPWEKFPKYAVFRHGDNRKWFCVIMDLHGEKLGQSEKGMLDVINVKCGPVLSGALRSERGIFPAYHMNKEHWVTVVLGEADDEKIKWLLDVSHDLTRGKK